MTKKRDKKSKNAPVPYVGHAVTNDSSIHLSGECLSATVKRLETYWSDGGTYTLTLVDKRADLPPDHPLYALAMQQCTMFLDRDALRKVTRALAGECMARGIDWCDS